MIFFNSVNNDISKLVVITCEGRVGIKGLSTPNPKNVNTTPIIAVITKPINTEAGTSRTYNINVIIIPINATKAEGAKRDPKPTKVDGSATIIPAPLRPRNAKKNPIPAPIPSFKSFGIIFKIDSLIPDTVIIKNIILATNTAASAVSHVLPISNIIV